MHMLVQCIVLAPVFPVVNRTEINLALQVPSFKQVEHPARCSLLPVRAPDFEEHFHITDL